MKPMVKLCTIAALALALLILTMTPAAAQDSEQYLPFIGASPSVERAVVEQPVEDAQPEAAPDAVPALLRHEPGHRSKVNDLDVRLAAGEIDDPLAGNSTLVAWDKVAMVLHGLDGKFIHKTYDVDANLGVPVAKERVAGLGVNGGGNMDVAAGYFTGEAGWMDTVAAWEYPAGKISLYVESYNSSLLKSLDATINTNDVVAGANATAPTYGGTIRVAVGNFDADAYDEFVVAWEGAGASLNLRVWDTNGTIAPVAKGTIAGETLGGYKFLDVATGDFNGDGKDEIAVAWQQGSDGYLAVKVYSVGSTGNLVAQGKLADAASEGKTPMPPGKIAITTGDFEGDAMDEIAVAYNVPAATNLRVYKASADLKTLTQAGMASVGSGLGLSVLREKVGRGLDLQAGDFSADGIDELALVCGAPAAYSCKVSVFATDVLTPTLRATLRDDAMGCYGGDLSVAVGDLNRDSIDEIAVGNVWGASAVSNRVDLNLFQVTPDLGSVVAKGAITGADAVGGTGHMAIAAGSFDGKNVRVGPPVYSHMDDTLQILAVINAPPKHKDTIDGVVHDVNVINRCLLPPCTYAKYETIEKSSTSMAVTTNRDWSVSAELKLSYSFVSASMSASYGESFEKTTSSFRSQEFGQDVQADEDDVIIRMVQSLNIWEYPVYADGTNVVQGHILVIWPDKVDPTCTSNCAAAITVRIDGENPTSYYQPNHELFNVMSYPPAAPTDIRTTIKSDNRNDLGPNGYAWWVKWLDIETDETKKSSKLDLGASLEVSGFGQSLSVSGSYSQGETAVNQVSFEQSTEIRLTYLGIAQTYSYGVRPFIYWAKPDGHLVLDYQVTPLTASGGMPNTWWQNTYNKADPTFNLPWKDGGMGPEYTYLSKEITCNPQYAAPGAVVAITAKVRNYSLMGANNVKVRFYLGDPDAGGTQIGQVTIAQLNPMSSTPAAIQFNTTGHLPGEVLKIYVVVDPDRTLAEVHEDNNKAYAQLPIVSPPMAGESGNLFVTAGDIVFDPVTVISGEKVHISATVHAVDATYAWVAVEFWDGSPSAGGQSIGGRLIPIVTAGGEATVGIDWPTAGHVGENELWVVLSHAKDRDITDNRASASVQVEPVHLYLPLFHDFASQPR
jgi:hypothetical protein